ncbi:MAG: DUF5060 domain-containing protein [Bacteroidia bacterium]|nr:DUF5060 domain-containing protein [Bacteroidia bacterium]
MKQFLTLAFAGSIISSVPGQVPFPCTRIQGGPYSSGVHTVYNSECVTSPGVIPVITLFDQQAQVEFKSGKSIKMLPGFRAGNFTTGHFLAHIEEPAVNAFIYSPANYDPINNPILKYSKFEIGIELPQSIQDQINDFIGGNAGINPYDPDQIKIQVDFQHQLTGNIYTRYGFYYQDVTASGNGWTINTNTLHPFRVRFAPPLDGFWYATIKLIVNNNQVGNPYVANFLASPSNEKGHLLVGTYKKTLKYENRESFFAIGRNVAFAEEDPWESCTSTPQKFNEQRSYISSIASNGGNFVRVRMDPWSNAIEWGTTQCGNYQNRQDHAWELDNTLTLCETDNMKMMLCLQGDAELSTFFEWDSNDNLHSINWGATGQGNPPNVIAQNPYYHLLGGPSVNPSPMLFLTDQSAKQYFKQRLFYINARWGYSTSIALWELMNETDNIGRYGIGPTQTLYNSTTVQQAVKDWHCEMSTYLSSFYPAHLTTTGYTGGGPKQFDQSSLCPVLSVLSGNSYRDDITMNSDARFHFKNSKFYYNYFNPSPPLNPYYSPKPFIFGEIGLDNGCFTCQDNDFHNATWATAFMGHMGSGLHWWDWENQSINHNANFLPLKIFISNIDFEATNYYSHVNVSHNIAQDKRIEIFWLADNAGRQGYGWIHNESVYWKNSSESCTLSVCDAVTTQPGTPYVIYEQLNNPKVEITGLNVLRYYDFDFYSTRQTGQYIGSHGNELANLAGTVKFRYKLTTVPDYTYNEYPDVAFRYRINGTNRITGDTVWLPNDTNLYVANPFPFSPGLGDTETYSLLWNFGFGAVSEDPNPEILFPGPGLYTVSLQLTDSFDHSTWIFQNFVFLDTAGYGSGRFQALPETLAPHFYPNPCRDYLFFLTAGYDYYELYSTTGELLISSKCDFEVTYIDLRQFSSSIYLLRLINERKIETLKILKE